MRIVGIMGPLLFILSGACAHAGRPVYSEVPLREVAAGAEAIVRGRLMEELRLSDCELSWRVRVIGVVRIGEFGRPGLRPVSGESITITNLGMASRTDCELRRGKSGGSGAGFAAARMVGGAKGWQAFLRGESVFLMLLAIESGRFRLAVDSSVVVDADLLDPE